MGHERGQHVKGWMKAEWADQLSQIGTDVPDQAEPLAYERFAEGDTVPYPPEAAEELGRMAAHHVEFPLDLDK